jgi:hypothetical protein
MHAFAPVQLVASTILIGAAAFARLDPVREGLNATYFTD